MRSSWWSSTKTFLLQEGGSRSDPVASSSKMISFELANGDPYGPHVPASIDDDEYVEYSFDNLADFPNNVEEEERVRGFFILPPFNGLIIPSLLC